MESRLPIRLCSAIKQGSSIPTLRRWASQGEETTNPTLAGRVTLDPSKAARNERDLARRSGGNDRLIELGSTGYPTHDGLFPCEPSSWFGLCSAVAIPANPLRFPLNITKTHPFL